MLLAAIWKLPVVWLLENNLYQQWTCVRLTYPKENLADLADGYDIPKSVVDGQDVLAVYEAVKPALDRARKGKGPTLLELKTYRYRVHSEGHPDYSVGCEGFLRPKDEVEAWQKRDPIQLFGNKLLDKGVLTQADIQRIDREAAEEMEAAEQFAAESPHPDPDDISKMLYAQ
jgi:pyruvate dehydrogenase E1 component alpha subunit